jgi:hypothetical protein
MLEEQWFLDSLHGEIYCWWYSYCWHSLVGDILALNVSSFYALCGKADESADE